MSRAWSSCPWVAALWFVSVVGRCRLVVVSDNLFVSVTVMSLNHSYQVLYISIMYDCWSVFALRPCALFVGAICPRVGWGVYAHQDGGVRPAVHLAGSHLLTSGWLEGDVFGVFTGDYPLPLRISLTSVKTISNYEAPSSSAIERCYANLCRAG